MTRPPPDGPLEAPLLYPAVCIARCDPNEPDTMNYQDVITARRTLLESPSLAPDGPDESILRSWQRCLDSGRDEGEKEVYDPVSRARISDLKTRNRQLMQAARGPMEELAQAVSGAGYALLLVDASGVALHVTGALERCQPIIQQAFRVGVDLSEHTIGTSAMTCAMDAGRAVRVSGNEHFFAGNFIFHCAAAPLYDPDGRMIGAIDITHDFSQPDLGILTLVRQCARTVEQALFRDHPGFLTLDLNWQHQQSSECLTLAFGEDGELTGANNVARRFLRSTLGASECRFDDIFEERFSDRAQSLLSTIEPVPLKLQSGVQLLASSKPYRRAQPARVAVSERLMAPAPAVNPPRPTFGDPAIDQAIDTALRAAGQALPILIQGETGTGKDVVANLIHARLLGSRAPFVALNCAAIPESLIEGELFGHVDGAFTGARKGGSAGKIEQADGGTLFLDEIGDMPAALQSRLLRVLESRTVVRLGDTQARQVNFQLITATHRQLGEAIQGGQFRQDLYYRICGYAFELSPLRERPQLEGLLQALLHDIGAGHRSLDAEAEARLLAYSWPGNVRELRHALTLAHAMAAADQPLQPAHFPMLQQMPTQRNTPRPYESQERLQSLERRAIQQALRDSEGNVTRAARLLGCSRATLYRRIKADPALR